MTPIHIPLCRRFLRQTPYPAQACQACVSNLTDILAVSQGTALIDDEPDRFCLERLASRWTPVHWYRELPLWWTRE